MDSPNEWTHPSNMPYTLSGNMWEYLAISTFLGPCNLDDLTIIYLAFIGQETADSNTTILF